MGEHATAPDGMAVLDLALAALRAAGCAGEVALGEREEWSTSVRLGEVETVESATTRGLRVTAYGAGNRSATCTTSDIAPEAVGATAKAAAELAAYADPDRWAGLPDPAQCGLAGGDLACEDHGWPELDRPALVRRVVEAERIALASDRRITNSHRSSVHATRSRSRYATTDGVRTARAATSFGYHVMVVAQDARGERQNGAYGTRARRLAGLDSEAVVGGEAGRRAVRGFGWRQLPSGPVRVLLHHEAASELLGIIAGAVQGGAVYRGSTWLAGALGTDIAAPALCIDDDPLLPGELGSRPCDGEGVRSRRVAVIDHGRLSSFLVNAYAARRLDHPVTGHDGGCSNLRLRPGRASFDDLVRELGDGLIVHDFHGFGVDLASGTISKGVDGFRVEHGRITHPVQGVTVAARLGDLLTGIRAIGNDPTPQQAVASPSLIVDGFTVGGT